MNTFRKKYFLWVYAFSVFFGVLMLFTFKLHSSYEFHPDFARDLFEILKIARGNLTLIGPKLTFGGLYTGPYYFYLFVPIFWMFDANILSVVYFNAFLFALSLGFLFWTMARKLSIERALLVTISLSLMPFMLTAAREPYNSYTYIPFLLFLLTYLYFYKIHNKFVFAVLGFLYGVIINFHFVNVLLLPGIIWWLVLRLKKKNMIWWFLLGCGISFVPLLVFEVKNRFVMFTNTFIHQSYKAWMSNDNIPNGMSGNKNPLINVWFLLIQLKKLMVINPMWLLLASWWITRKESFSNFNKRLWGAAVLTLLIFAVVLRFQFIAHYIFSLALVTVFVAIMLLARSKWYWLLGLIVVLQLLKFPLDLYHDAERNPDQYRDAIQYIVDNKLITPEDDFNVVQITDPKLMSTIGFEYRYFFLKYGFESDSEFLYSSSPFLFVFSDRPEYEVSEFPSWELDQFGRVHLGKADMFKYADLLIYRVSK